MDDEERWNPLHDAAIGRSTNDILFKVLSDPYRRYFLYDILDRGTMTADDLEAATEEWVAAAGPVDESDPDHVLVKMYHVHVPMMEKAGLVSYDSAHEEFTVADLPERVEEIVSLARDNERREEN